MVNHRESVQTMVKKVNSNLPGDIIQSNILTRIPVKTLIRFMAVCKTWYSIIFDPYFINMYNQIQKNKISNLLLVHYSHENRIIVTNSCSPEQSPLLSFKDTSDFSDKYVDVVGCCNGVVCVFTSSSHPDNYFSTIHHISLWNPALRVNKIIANYDHNDVWASLCIGFGYNSQTNDYNLIIFTNNFSTLKHVNIYSLNSNSWRKIDQLGANQLITERYRDMHLGVYVSCCSGEAYCWLAFKQDHYGSFPESAIISFHMEDETFKELMLPKYTNGHHGVKTLFIYKDSLAMLDTHIFDANYTRLSPRICYIWVMKEYDDPKSWTKLCQFDSQLNVSFLGVIKIEQILLRTEQGGNKEVNVVDIHKSKMNPTSYTKDFTKAMWVSSFTESLVLLNGVHSKNSHSN